MSIVNTLHDIVFVRSQDRNFGTPSSYIVNLPVALKNISSIQLLSAEIPYSFYSVGSAYTAGVTFTNGTLNSAFSMSTGFHTVDTIRSALLTWLQATYPASGVTAVNYNSTMGKLSIAFTTGTLSVVTNNAGSLGYIMGVSSTTTVSVSQVLTFPNVVNVYPITSLFINITNLSANVYSTSGFNSVFRVQVNVQPNGVIFVNNAQNVFNTVYLPSTLSSLNQLNIQIVDENNNLVDFNGQEWFFSLGVTHN